MSISPYGQESSSTFTLDLGSGFKNINLTSLAAPADTLPVRIYPSSTSNSTYVDCWCTRWDESNYDMTFETYLNKTDRDKLYNNVRPGAVRELYKVLGKPTFIDSTYASANSLIFEPTDGWGVSGVREKRIIGVKTISDTFINKDYFNVKVEGKILSSL